MTSRQQARACTLQRKSKPRVVARGGLRRLGSKHPGVVPHVEQEVLNTAMLQYVSSVKEPSEIFNFSTYQDMRRSQQICATGLMDNERIIMCLAELNTGLRFKPLQLQDAILHSLAESEKS